MNKKNISQILDEWATKEMENAPDIRPKQEHYEQLEMMKKKPRSFFFSWSFRFAVGSVAAAVMVVLLVFYSDLFQRVQPQLAEDILPETKVVGGIKSPEKEMPTSPRLASSDVEKGEKREGKKGARILQAPVPQEEKKTLKIYPFFYQEIPPFSSPFITEDKKEMATVYSEKGYSIIPMTIGNWEPYESYYEKFMKGDQLSVDDEDFPSLAESGLHSEEDLEKIKTITDKPISEITEIGRPEQSSGIGFMGDEEDIISVLKGDNKLVEKMGLTHPQMARPLFHIWNILIFFMEQEGVTRQWKPFEYVHYNRHKVFIKAMSTRGFQESIFNDEIRGSFQIEIWRELDPEEMDFLKKAYPSLSQDHYEEMINKLSYMHIGEMNPYYILRYGFYEGHTSYRADPVAIALIFGLRSIQEIESFFMGNLYNVLLSPFSEESLDRN